MDSISKKQFHDIFAAKIDSPESISTQTDQIKYQSRGLIYRHQSQYFESLSRQFRSKDKIHPKNSGSKLLPTREYFLIQSDGLIELDEKLDPNTNPRYSVSDLFSKVCEPSNLNNVPNQTAFDPTPEGRLNNFEIIIATDTPESGKHTHCFNSSIYRSNTSSILFMSTADNGEIIDGNRTNLFATYTLAWMSKDGNLSAVLSKLESNYSDYSLDTSPTNELDRLIPNPISVKSAISLSMKFPEYKPEGFKVTFNDPHSVKIRQN